ncbi:hypothetical protein J8F10_37240 [Gemmata sp. G18]|uniref:Lipoprotein n=1 Tax=Gemmata palustris TaxID=2822762 RepID=A0ABS5C4I5_9BACT|nr:hypothetical protein [Gemmata palustris]MBP3960901.1 hypothetical protein [Gemmata palustris]
MTTRLMGPAAVLATVALAGCGLLDRVRDKDRPPPAPPTFSQYHLEGWQWENVRRVVVLPFRNESGYTRAGEEARDAFTAELQRAGRFEVISTPVDDRALLAAQVRCGGRFDEVLLYEIALATNADVVVHATVSNYSPYPRPRLGLVIQAVGSQEGKVVASVDGLWDSTDLAIAERVRIHYRERARERPPWVRNHVIAADDSFASELALDSPILFRRFVGREAVLTLLGLPVPGVVMGAAGADAGPAGNCRVGCAPVLAPGAPVVPAAGTVR